MGRHGRELTDQEDTREEEMETKRKPLSNKKVRWETSTTFTNKHTKDGIEGTTDKITSQLS